MSGWTLEFLVDDLGILEVRKKSVVYIHNLTSNVDVFNIFQSHLAEFSPFFSGDIGHGG